MNGLTRQLARGEPEAFEELFDSMGGEMLAYACTILGSTQDSEDVVQSTMLRLVRYRRRLCNIENLKAYVLRVLRNEALRQCAKRDRPSVEVPDIPDETDDRVVGDSLRDLDWAIASLPLEQSEVINLKHRSGMTFQEIGEVMEISPNTAASRHRYAIEKLRSLMEHANEH